MRKIRRIGLSLVLAIVLTLGLVAPALATNPTVSITVTASVTSITNTITQWDIGTITTTATVYFSATGAEDLDYSQILNNGSTIVDIEIQGAIIEGGDYDWALSATGEAGNQTYGLLANNPSGGATYNVTVKSSAFVDLTTGLAIDGTYNWTMKFLGPTAFSPADDGNEKSTTVTLVASPA